MATFHTNCTLPSGFVNYVTAPNTRGTLQILWSCLGTLLLCTWTVQHLNVPQQSVPQTGMQSLTRRIRRFWTKVKWMLLTLLAPELVLGKAYSDYCSARKHFGEYKSVAENDGVAWSISHTFLANMGAFAIVFNDEAKGRLATTSDSAQPADNNTLTVEPQSVGQDLHTQGHSGDQQTAQPADNNALTVEPQSMGQDLRTQGHSGDQQTAQPAENNALTVEPQSMGQDLRTQGHSSAQQSNGIVSGSVRQSSQATSLDPNSNQVQEHDPEADNNNMALSEDAAFSLPTCTVKPDRKNPKNPRLRIDFQTRGDIVRQLSQNRFFGPEACARLEMADSNAIGSINWAPDTRNTNLVISALDEMQLKGFPTFEEASVSAARPINWYTNLMALQGNIWRPDACQLLLARKMGIINKLPSVSADEVDDQNKGDFLVKGLAVGQVLWLIVQLIARGAKGLVPSQLEIVVLAFSICTFAMYVLLWKKPQDVKTPRYISAYRYPSMNELSWLAMSGPTVVGPFRRGHWIPNNSIHCDGSAARGPRKKFLLASILAAIIFGSLHCAAWNLHFPTAVERLLWRIAAVTTTGGPPVAVVANMFILSIIRLWYFQSFLLSVLPVPYFLARVYITIEIFRSLCFLDPETFMTTWSVNIPHLS